MSEGSERRAQCLAQCRHLHSVAVKQMLHLHALGRLSESVRQFLDGGQLQHIPGLREGEIVLLSGLVAFSDLAARFCASWPLAFRSAHWTLCTSDLFPSHDWQ
jgi:hypothetical protein